MTVIFLGKKKNRATEDLKEVTIFRFKENQFCGNPRGARNTEDKESTYRYHVYSRLGSVVLNQSVTVLCRGLPERIKNHINKQEACNLVNFSTTPVSFTKNVPLHRDFKLSLSYVMVKKQLRHFTVRVMGRISTPFLF